MDLLEDKYRKLEELLKECGRVLVAYSGGTDSAFLLAVAARVLADRVLAVTAVSATSTAAEVREAKELARQLGVRHLVVRSGEMQHREFIENSPLKCYYCKQLRFSHLQEIARQNKIPWVLDGSNLDDLQDYRPGLQAVKELGVRSPLREVGLTKADIRALSRQLELPTWNKPSAPCLASRIPYGEEISEEKLRRVEEAEQFLKSLGFSPVRVRHPRGEARVEIAREQFLQLTGLAETVTRQLKELGFARITLDLCGFRSGSLNEELSNYKGS
ncbi:ATP-dependent sacrificial sulfur transferase LarE [Desulforamulus putei]|uniref:ATP-dependent sacrificial sulfur transferase LarE n=1 Tax=Desulforamulus putei TaxID=74701 RepID=UPI002FDCD846